MWPNLVDFLGVRFHGPTVDRFGTLAFHLKHDLSERHRISQGPTWPLGEQRFLAAEKRPP